jgi:hypothetical protein
LRTIAELASLNPIREYIKAKWGWQGLAPQEQLHFPENGEVGPILQTTASNVNTNAQMGSLSEATTAYVDSFLLSEDDISELVANDELHSSYCGECGSVDVHDTGSCMIVCNCKRLKLMLTFG